MEQNPDLTQRLCEALAVMVVEVEGTMQFMGSPPPDLVENTEAARQLIADAGHDFDVLYPQDRRPRFGEGSGPDPDSGQH